MKEFSDWLRPWLIFPLGYLNGWLVLLLFNRLQPLSSLLITAIVLAFLLNLPIQLLQQRGLNRGAAIGLVFIVTLSCLALLSLVLVPLIIEELSELVTNLPGLIDSGSQQLQAFQAWAIAQQFPGNLSNLAERGIGQLSQLLQATSSQLLYVILGTISRAINILLLIVLTIFIVLGGENAWDGLFSWVPSPWSLPLQNSIQSTFRGYFASQALLAGILSIAQTIVFLLLDVPYAVLYGVSIGVAILIPYASTLMIIIVSVLVALDNFSLGLKVFGVAIMVSFLNDNLLSPRIMSHSIGLNPIWLIVSLFLGGKTAGILGLVIAVPIASVVKQMADIRRLSSESE
ncbi:MAG: AI-2E family transporter [Acaryochloris sp. RU_4_1]|nr:AI-2E family transporter [Acaryochloris sp. RU_4_1]NJR57011.1 AI-2E family transporter [Acaryochloris sp. CRU_2_0]